MRKQIKNNSILKQENRMKCMNCTSSRDNFCLLAGFTIKQTQNMHVCVFECNAIVFMHLARMNRFVVCTFCTVALIMPFYTINVLFITSTLHWFNCDRTTHTLISCAYIYRITVDKYSYFVCIKVGKQCFWNEKKSFCSQHLWDGNCRTSLFIER